MRANRSWVKQFAELQVEHQLLKTKVKTLIEKWREKDGKLGSCESAEREVYIECADELEKTLVSCSDSCSRNPTTAGNKEFE